MKKNLELYGWVLFLIGIVIWVTQSIMAEDILGTLAATTWLVGCSLFILAHRIKGECPIMDINSHVMPNMQRDTIANFTIAVDPVK